MILPILSFGHQMLREKCKEIESSYPALETLIADMWETLYWADGYGLAAPQIGKPIKLFIVNSIAAYNRLNESGRDALFTAADQGITETFINARILNHSGNVWTDEEGCLSIPYLTQPVERPYSIEIEYLDKHFMLQRKVYSGATARLIQQEYDHTEGILYLDYLSPSKKHQIHSKLRQIVTGKVPAQYPMKYII